ncbi:unnamed protein product [Meloidogyne enterolobii]|uniref:Uncharacterized protein n=2 Tax=Meloidogyne enterolobii TaxID=390850 RepID=A0ACB0ZAH0_MELEN
MRKECRLTCGTCKQFIYYLENDYENKSKMKIKKEKIGAGKNISFLHKWCAITAFKKTLSIRPTSFNKPTL